MKVKITTLVENTTGSGLGLIAEHGLSFLIETETQKILFDTGQGLALVSNAAALNVDLGLVDSVVLSHGHIDHAGGLTQLLAQNQALTLYAHPGVFDNKLLAVDGGFISVGVAGERAAVENSGIEMRLSDKPVELSTGIKTTGLIPMNSGFEEIEPMFYVGEKGSESPDFLYDDMALILESDKGTVVVLGCTHRGIINTLNHVASLTGSKKIHAVMGGLHLLHADAKKTAMIIDQLQQFNIEKLVVGHCTGFEAIHALRDAFGNSLVLNAVGLVQEF